ncbi:aminoacyl-tRNA hydrolase [Candidatus Parcubacteria bacterium]|nr:MAG: aminoacyl-tRNA hydrolase [Candidatus Parcubacteria bacterium]
MKIIVGLGNPGTKYKNTRHNIGFCVVDEFKKDKDFSRTKIKKLAAEVFKTNLSGEGILLLKPQTFMNRSGDSVAAALKYFKAGIKDLIVIHDDFDLPIGKIRISHASSSGGHKGVQDIMDKLKNSDFTRLRIGISPEIKGNIKAEKFVLENFGKKEKDIIVEKTPIILEALDILISQGAAEAMNLFNS